MTVAVVTLDSFKETANFVASAKLFHSTVTT